MAHRPRTRSAAAIQARTQQLLERDPEYAALNQLPALSDRSAAQQSQARDLEMRLSLRYGAAVMPWPSQVGRADYRTHAADFTVAYLRARDLNEPLPPWPVPLPPGRRTRSLLTDTDTLEPIDPLWASYPPRLRVLVRLDLVKTHDIERLTGQFRRALRACLQQSGRELHALRWLRTVAPAVFNWDLRRYDLHTQEHLTFRQIAYLEQVERRVGRPPMPAQLYGKTISVAPHAESSVRTAVVRIYESIHGVKYRARRRAPGGSNVGLYDCPTHPHRDCGPDCPVMQQWWARLRPSLPKPDSGA